MHHCLLLLALVVNSEGSNWPAFLGDGHSKIDTSSIPVEWSPESNLAWAVSLDGYGQSSPVIQNGHVYVTCVEGDMKDTCSVFAFDLKDGNRLWKKSFDSSEKVKSSTYVSRAAPTPVTDSDRIICFFESGDLVCLDHDGNVQWQRSLTEEYGAFENRFCIGASPAQDDERVYILADHEGPSYVLAVDKATGENVWKKERESRVSWSSPALLPVNGQETLVVSSSGSVDGYDPKTGQLLWSNDEVGGNTSPTPRPVGDGTFLIGASPGSRGESTEVASQSNCLMRIVDEGEGPVAKKVWLAEKALSSFGSPICHQGLCYWVNRAGVVFCFDVETGERKYSERLAESNWATPLALGDRIYFFGRGGDTTVIAAGGEFKRLATNRLWVDEAEQSNGGRQGGNFGGQTQYGAAVVDGSLLIRTGNKLYCVRQSEE